MFKIFLLIFLCSSAFSCDEYKMKQIMYKYDLDIEVKSYKGWIRLFSNLEKLKESKIHIKENDRLLLIACLKTNVEKDTVGVL